MHHLLVDHFAVLQVHRPAELERGELGDALARRQEHRHHEDAVAGPLHLGREQALFAQLRRLRETHGDVVLGVELVDEGDLLGVAEGAAADQVARPGAMALGQVVLAEVVADGRHVVGGALDDGARRHAAVGVAGDAVVVRLRVLARVDEVGLLGGGEVAALAHHRLEEEHGPLLDLAHPRLELRRLAVDLDHLAQAVHPDEALPGRVHGRDVVVVPRDVASLVGRDRALDVGAGQAADHEVHGVGHRGLASVRLHVAGVLLGAHLELAEEVAQGDGVGQVHAHARRRRGVGRDRAQADVLLRACRPRPRRRC